MSNLADVAKWGDGAKSASREYLQRRSFIELSARDRAKSLLDPGTPRELADPFDRIESPWLSVQGVTPQADDGCIVMRGTINGNETVVIAFSGAFQGGGIGEVSGAKLTAALDLACLDNEDGKPTSAVMLLETGGVRLQEANLGLAAVAEIISSIIALRRYAPVISLIAGPVGCFGGMSLAAGVSSYIVMTREGRLGLNGPEVIEEESGVEEFDASDRSLIMTVSGRGYRFTKPVIAEPRQMERSAVDAGEVLLASGLDPFRNFCHGSFLLEKRTAPALRRAMDFFEQSLRSACEGSGDETGKPDGID